MLAHDQNMDNREYQRALRQVAHLLKLAEHKNTSPEESAVAAAKAQEIMLRYKITRLVEEAASEAIISHGHEPLERSKKKVVWRGLLANEIAQANFCRIFYSWKGTLWELTIIGTEENAETTRYFYGFLVNEVDRLTDAYGKGKGKSWCNNFRLGVVDTLRQKLQEMQENTINEMRNEASQKNEPMALVRVDFALAKITDHVKQVEKYIERLDLKSAKSVNTPHDPSAYAMGQMAGKSIDLADRRRKMLK